MTNNKNQDDFGISDTPPRRHEYLWRNKYLTAEDETLDDMITSLQAAADCLRDMRAAGVVLDEWSGMADDYAVLVTADPAVAERFGFEPVSGEDSGEEEADADAGIDAGEEDDRTEIPDIAAAIEVHVVTDGEQTRGWIHTHGMAAHGQPELEMRHVPLFLAPVAVAVLRSICRYMLTSPNPILAGQTMLQGEVPIRFITPDPFPGDEEHYRHPRLQIIDIDAACDCCSGR